MVLGNWDFFDDGSTSQNIQTTSPLVGGGSLQVIGGSFEEWHAQLNSGEARGFAKGRVRTLIRTESIGFNITSFNPGLFCLSSQEDLTTTGDFYCVVIQPTALADNVRLKKITGGINNITSTGSLDTATKVFSVGTTVAMELEWVSDASATALTVRLGDALNYSDLAVVMVSVDDAPGHYSTGFAEGLVVETDNSGAYDVTFDETEIDVGT